MVNKNVRISSGVGAPYGQVAMGPGSTYGTVIVQRDLRSLNRNTSDIPMMEDPLGKGMLPLVTAADRKTGRIG